jgi:MoxR-like ATPase
MQIQGEIDSSIADAVTRVNAHLETLSARFVSRRALLELVLLGLVSREHVLLIGPPGTGKSAAVQAIAGSFDTVAFEYLIGRFTEPSELFGALDLNALKDGQIRPVTEGMLPQAEIAFLDEIFLGSTAILNTLLKILNERTYRRGQYSIATPLISCVAASNAIPEDSALAAFADRFLMTMFVDPVDDEALSDLLRSGWTYQGAEGRPSDPLPRQLLSHLYSATLQVDMSSLQDAYAHLVRKARLVGVTLSDRKIVKGQKLIAAAAVLRGAAVAGPEDLWPVTYLVQSKGQQEEVREVLQAELRQSHNPVLSQSVARATYGPTAHAAHLAQQAGALLDAAGPLPSGPPDEAWLVRVETMVTRIDAAFEPAAMPQHLRALRSRLEAALEAKPRAAPEADAGGEQANEAA